MCENKICTCYGSTKPLRLEVGKTYVDIQGSIVRVVCKRKVTSKAHAEFIGLASFAGNSEVPHYYFEDGRCTFSPSCNLSNEYREPKIHKRDVIWWKSLDGLIYCGSYSCGYQLNSAKELKRQTVEFVEES